MKNGLHIICLLLFPLLAVSQPFAVKGRVSNAAGVPLQHVTLLLHSTGFWYETNADGDFSLPLTTPTDTVTIFYEGYEKQQRVISAGRFNEIILKKPAVIKSAVPNRLLSVTLNPANSGAGLQLTGNESYSALIENGFVSTQLYPATEVSLGIDQAAYSNIRRFLTLNSRVPPDAVRIEEMLNYFNLSYTEPPGNATFSIQATLTACPWNKNSALLLAQVNSKKLNLTHVPPTHLVFLIDVSGSMDLPHRLPLLKSGFKALVNNLRPVDTVSIVVYGGTVGVALYPTSGGEKSRILQTLDSLQPGGATPGESGIKLAYSLARAHFIKGGNNRVILATDGDFNVGLKREEELEALIVQQRREGIYLTCLGVGMGNYKDSKIQTLAQRGNGNFAYLDSYAEAEKVLLKEFLQTLYTVADHAYLVARFNPEVVSAYRLIGFENKAGMLYDSTATLEGGNVGPASSLLVAFELQMVRNLQSEQGAPVEFLLHYQATGAPEPDVVRTQPALPFTPFEQLRPEQRFVSAALLFGSLLRNSKFVKTGSWNEVLKIARPAVEAGSFAQQEFLHLVELAKKLYGKRWRRTVDE